MNGLLLGATALPVAGLAGPFLAFFVPPRCARWNDTAQPNHSNAVEMDIQLL